MLNQQIYLAGPGAAIWTQNTDYLGNALTYPTPSLLGVMQDHSIDEKRDAKKLYGQNNMPVAIMGGKFDTSISIKLGTLDQILANSIFYGQTVATGTLTGLYIDNSAGTAVPVATSQLIPTAPYSGTVTTDRGVINVANNQRLIPVSPAALPAAGQYSFGFGIASATLGAGGTGYLANDTITLTAAQGGAVIKVLTVSSGAVVTFSILSPGAASTSSLTSVGAGATTSGSGSGATFVPTYSTGPGYLFSAADRTAGVSVWTNYSYTASAVNSTGQTIYQAPIGPIVTGRLDIIERSANSSALHMRSYSNVVCSDVKRPAKQDDFTIYELKFEPFLSAGGSFVTISEYNP